MKGFKICAYGLCILCRRLNILRLVKKLPSHLETIFTVRVDESAAFSTTRCRRPSGQDSPVYIRNRSFDWLEFSKAIL